jgi:hypothetical protein
MILVIVVAIMVGLIFLAGTVAIRSVRQTQGSAVELGRQRAFYAAEAAVEWGSANLKTLLRTNVDPTQAQLDAMPPPVVNGFTFDGYRVLKTGGLTQERISVGDYKGLQGLVQRFTVTAGARGGRGGSQVVREIQNQLIPLFQFGVFYEGDLEIFPGPSMTFIGPIHTNSNLYMGAESEIRCQSLVTAVGNYWHYRKDTGHTDPTGAVWIKDVLGNWQNVWRGSYWLDERQSTWAVDALGLWGGQFQDQAFDLEPLRLPLEPTGDQHVAVEPGLVGDGPTEIATKYWYKATVRYVSGALTNGSGTPIVQPGVFTYTADKFWDLRENRRVDVVKIDIAQMVAGGYRPTNGILYVTDTRGDRPVVEIVNGGTVPVGGLTIVTNLPMYVQGNFNTVAKKGASLYCDAMTLLSPAWADANSNHALNTRIPSNQTVNAAILTGHVPTPDGGTYSGGLENNFRFLENWTTQTVTYRGSIIDLWFSRYNVAPWSYGVYYTAPVRVWSFDTDFLNPANWPPGAPRVQTVQRGAWRQIS